MDPVVKGRLSVLAPVGAAVLLANLATPFWADDYCRAVDAGLVEAARLASVEYGNWSGRWLVTFLNYALLGDGIATPWAFVLLNAAAFVALAAVILAIADRLAVPPPGRTAGDGAVEAGFAALALWWLPPSIAEAALWRAGAVGYLWAVLLELCVLLLVAATPRAGPAARLALALLAFAAATMLETAALAATLALALLSLHRLRGGTGRVPWLETASHAAGFLTAALAPGNRNRAALTAGDGLPDGVLERLDAVAELAGRLVDPYGLLVLAALLLPFALAAVRSRRSGGGRAGAAAGRNRIWILPAGAGLYLATLLFVPAASQAARLAFPASVLLAALLAALALRRPRGGAERRAFAGAVALGLAATLAQAAPDLAALRRADAAVRAAALAAPPGSDALVPDTVPAGEGRVFARKHRFRISLSPDPADGYNRCFARAFGLASVRVERP